MLMIFVFLFVVPLFVYAIRASFQESREFTKAIKVSRIVFITLVLVLILLFLLEKRNYYLVGYRSTSIVFILTASSGIVYAFTDKRFILGSVKRIILNLIALVLMSGAGILVFELIVDFKDLMVYSDTKFRLEFRPPGFMSGCQLPVLYIKQGLLERKIEISQPDSCLTYREISSVNIAEVDSGYSITYFLKVKPESEERDQFTVYYKKPGK
jgi:hypothetical protein